MLAAATFYSLKKMFLNYKTSAVIKRRRKNPRKLLRWEFLWLVLASNLSRVPSFTVAIKEEAAVGLFMHHVRKLQGKGARLQVWCELQGPSSVWISEPVPADKRFSSDGC